jgi:hypothetical protein
MAGASFTRVTLTLKVSVLLPPCPSDTAAVNASAAL